MAVTEQKVQLTAETVERVQEELRSRGLDGWLLFDFRGSNPVALSMLGLPALTRRYLVYLPAAGRPVAITHRIEQQPWTGWIGENRPYASWRELEERLGEVLGGARVVATEYEVGNAVPTVDRIPAGALELIRGTGVEVRSSGDLVSTFYSRWTPEGEASHRRASQAVFDTAHAAFEHVAHAVHQGSGANEWDVRQWVTHTLRERGLTVEPDSIVAVNANAANPHYAPSREAHAPIRRGDLLLLDLWGKEPGPDAVFGDQTWMAYVGDEVPERLEEIFAAVRDARDAAVALARRKTAAGEPVAGWELDDAARGVIEGRGYGPHFIHRTGHSIDRELHGSGPNLDNLETRDTRTLIPGVGFSVEPGIYLEGDVGFRSEINVFVGPDGPEVTTPRPQQRIYPLLRRDPFGG